MVAGLIVGTTALQAAVIAGCGLIVFGLGLLDDLRGLGPVPKLTVEAGLAVLLWAGGVRAGFFDIPPLDLLLTVGWVVVITNAVNLTDNMDGLASGIAAIASLAYFAIAAPQGDYLVASFAIALAGASLGFLRHNFPPARIFLGDAGSLPLGFLLASLGLLLDLDVSNDVERIAVQALIIGVPVFDTILVVLAPATRGPTRDARRDRPRLASARGDGFEREGGRVRRVPGAQVACSAIADGREHPGAHGARRHRRRPARDRRGGGGGVARATELERGSLRVEPMWGPGGTTPHASQSARSPCR